MKKASRRTRNDNKPSLSVNHQGMDQCKVASVSARASRQYANGKAVGVALASAVAVVIGVWVLAVPLAQAQNLGSPPFANPSEIRYRPSEKRLRGVMELISGQYQIPNVGMATLRQFRGWDPAQAKPNFGPDLGPGPTLRVRLGDMVEISFLNKIDDSQFPYTFDTNSPPGFSGFGCDKSGTIYPENDKFPNCFHGSSTANIHFHGTHTDPNGLGDDVLVQVLPQLKQPDWTATFNKIFDSGKIPQKWADLPENYKKLQLGMIHQHDVEAAEQARKNKLPPPESLLKADQQMIAAGQWPQYLMGAFPNFFEVPDYSSGKFKAGQAPGTHWYHAHKHGSTSLHSLNGMAGAVVIESTQEGGYDQVIRKFYGWGDNYGDHEKIIVVQEFDSTLNIERSGPNGKEQMLVNGKVTPTIAMRPGEVQLWRLLNATVGDGITPILQTLQDKGFVFKQTAQDGVQFSQVNYTKQPFLSNQVPGGLTLASGNRADLLVQAPSTPVGVVALNNNDGSTSPPTLFFVNVSGANVTLPNGPFPTAWAEMPKFLLDLPKPGPNDITNPGSPVRFQVRQVGNDLPHLMINNKQFEETGPIVDQCMPLNGLQDWVLENYTTTAAHPFHIHVNPFQVIEIDTPTGLEQYSKYAPTDNFVWQDVIAIPIANQDPDGNITPGRITIRQTYPDFAGTFVLHCHILTHEDRGMMQLVRIVPADHYPMACQGAIPQHH